MEQRTVVGMSEVALGVLVVFLAAGRSEAIAFPAVVETLGFFLFLAGAAARSTYVSLLTKPEPMRRSIVIAGGVLLIVPMSVLALFYGPENPLIGVFGPLIIGELYRQLFVSIETKDESMKDDEA